MGEALPHLQDDGCFSLSFLAEGLWWKQKSLIANQKVLFSSIKPQLGVGKWILQDKYLRNHSCCRTYMEGRRVQCLLENQKLQLNKQNHGIWMNAATPYSDFPQCLTTRFNNCLASIDFGSTNLTAELFRVPVNCYYSVSMIVVTALFLSAFRLRDSFPCFVITGQTPKN